MKTNIELQSIKSTLEFINCNKLVCKQQKEVFGYSTELTMSDVNGN